LHLREPDVRVPLIPARILDCLRPPRETDGPTIERVDGGFRCPASGRLFPDRDSVPSLLVGVDDDQSPITGRIKAFYEQHPFPNYEGIQSFGDLVERGRSNPFGSGLLDAVGYNKLILECGCGTGQLSHFLSLNNNHVLGVDLSLSSLKLAIEHKQRFAVPRSCFIQMNIFELAIKDNAFDVVISTGVLHHTKDARRAFGSIAKKCKPGGIVVVGLYNSYARWPTLLRSKLIGILGPRIDYVVRKRIHDARKAEIWVKDQYYNPHETWHSIDEVVGWFAENGIEYLNCRPPIIGSNAGGMFQSTAAGTAGTRILTQLSWLGSISAEGALFVMIGRKRGQAPAG
jgi:2-polyprenyl-3-methyl-5-hydroxy-6-metoxy-1,4-benzoquinol methylase